MMMKGSKTTSAEFPKGNNIGFYDTFRKIILPITTIVLLITFSISSYSNTTSNDPLQLQAKEQRCNVFKGEWVPFPEGPYYTNETRCAIEDKQNCIKFGRPDTEFLKWRWQPDECDLAMFDAEKFLELVRGKTVAFLGDSVARNQMQSLVCLLASVADPEDISYGNHRTKFRRWMYRDYNFTVEALWSPHLVKSLDVDPNGYSPNSLMSLYLDEPDRAWTGRVQAADIVVVSAGQWFFRPFYYYENGRIIGCHNCPDTNITRLTNYYAYGAAFRTAFRALSRLSKPRGIVILRTFSPAHFENGDWDKGGSCERTRPLGKHETKFEGYIREMYSTQMREFRAAQRRGNNRGLRLRLMDTTEAMLMRPDGHPNRYGHSKSENVSIADCVHWCLPGPVETWNELLLHVLNMENDDEFTVGKITEKMI